MVSERLTPGANSLVLCRFITLEKYAPNAGTNGVVTIPWRAYGFVVVSQHPPFGAVTTPEKWKSTQPRFHLGIPMNLIWVMLLLPVNAHEEVTVFPKTFATRAQCESFGHILIVQREFRCTKSEVRIELVEVPGVPGSADRVTVGFAPVG